jgi:subtilisin family serine protease
MRYLRFNILVLLSALVSLEVPALRAQAADSSAPRLLVMEKSRASGLGKSLAAPAAAEMQIVELKPGEDSRAALEALENAGFYAEPDASIEGHAQPNDEHFPLQWHLQTGMLGIEAPAAWDEVNNTGDVVIAVLDSGCDRNHPDIAPNLWRNEGEIPDNGVDDDGNGYVDDLHGYDFVNDDGEPNDDSGHGSMVFGILAAAGDNDIGISGVAWRARVMCLKVLRSDADGKVSDAIEAMLYAVKEGAKVLNLSWGYQTNAPSLFLLNAIGEAGRNGLVIVASAGNLGLENRTGLGEMATYPASFEDSHLISVASSGQEGKLSPFSNYGAESVDLAAPGEDLLTTTVDGYGAFTGTSASVAVVSGVAALVWAQYPAWSAEQVKQRILETVIVESTLEGKTLTGGRIDLAKSVDLNRSHVSDVGTQDGGAMGGDAEGGAGACSIGSPAGQGSGLGFGLVFGWFGIKIFLQRLTGGLRRGSAKIP